MLALGISDQTQSWTASVSPGNRTTSWLTLSQYAGTGPANITLTARTMLIGIVSAYFLAPLASSIPLAGVSVAKMALPAAFASPMASN